MRETRESPYTRYAKTVSASVGKERRVRPLSVRVIKVDDERRRKDGLLKCGLQIGSQ